MSIHCVVAAEPIDTARVLARVGSPADGAAVLFVGTVREQNDGRAVRGMRYDAYIEMAVPVLRAIAGEAVERAGSDRIAVEHRIGELAIGDISIAIAVSSPHRAGAFDAARYIIEQVKVRLPVWKQEHYVGGDSAWLDGALPPVEAHGRG